MKIKQFIGPFTNNSQIDVGSSLSGATFVQIGIEHPRTPPYSEIDKNVEYPYPVILNINSVDYVITERDVLEFSNLSARNMNIIIKDIKNPYLLINVGYE